MSAYVILLKKALGAPAQESDRWISEAAVPDGHWIALGHVDEIYSYPLPEQENLLLAQEQMQKEVHTHNSGNVFYHPMFVLQEAAQDNGISHDAPFAAFVRIHFAQSINISPQFDLLKEYLLSSPDFFLRIFRTTEFSDMLVELRGENLSKLIRFALQLRYQPQVGKMYTYFGLSADYLRGNALPDKDDVLDFCSLRFSDPIFESDPDYRKSLERYCRLIFRIFGRSAFCVTGVDDILIRGKNIPASTVILLLRKWYRLQTDGNPNVRTTTRVGFKLDRTKASASVLPGFEPLCKPLADAKDQVLSRFRDTQPGWLIPAAELSNALIRMSRSPVMDEIVYLLAPSLHAFFRNILDNHDPASRQTYIEFIERCSNLMSQLLRLEDQLSAQSEFRPAIYDIPVFMLEYTIAFLQKVTSCLLKGDERTEAEYVFLPLPCLNDQVRTVEIFPTSKELPGLVQMEFPVEDLYRPERLLPALSHEISHHIGVNYRRRDVRLEYYCTALAADLAASVFETLEGSLISYFIDSLHGWIDSLSLAPDLLTLTRLTEESVRWINFTFFGPDDSAPDLSRNYSDFIRGYLMQAESCAPIIWFGVEEFNHRLNEFASHIAEISQLFREVYADMCMLHILGYGKQSGRAYSTDNYIGQLLSSLHTHPKYDPSAFAIRIYACLCALGVSRTYSKPELQEEWVKVDSQCRLIEQYIQSGDDGGCLLFPVTVIDCLAKYAASCYKLMYSRKDKAVDEVRTLFGISCTANETFFTDAIDCIDTWRKSMDKTEPQS